MPIVEKRKLEFDGLTSALAEAERLLDSGYQAAGNWNFSQCCGHLNEWLRYPMDGFPKSNPAMNALMWILRSTIGKKQLQSVLEDGFKANLPTMPATVPAPDAIDDQAALATLKSTVERFMQYD